MDTIYRKADKVMVWLWILSNKLSRFLEDLVDMRENGIRLVAETLCELQPCSRGLYASIKLKSYISRQVATMDITRRKHLRECASLFDALPYWDRIWIAQELLMPSERTRILVFSGSMFVELKDLGEQLKCIKYALARQEGTTKDALPIGMVEYYRAWRAWRTLGSPAFQPSLATLLTCFSHCGCQHKRDRIFALSSFVEEQIFIDIDYGADRVTLFRRIMDGYMSNKPINEVLHFGAILIQILEVRKPPQDHESQISLLGYRQYPRRTTFRSPPQGGNCLGDSITGYPGYLTR
jgi:hypothetical protein